MEKIRILLADDHPQVRAQICSRLRREPDLAVIGEAADSQQALAIARLERPALVLIDPFMRDGLGLEAIRRLAVCLPDMVIVVLAAVTDTAQRMALRKEGARQILDKGFPSEQLVKLLRQMGQRE
jgi:two-component system, NarL family, invasion response regulator UvrY